MITHVPEHPPSDIRRSVSTSSTADLEGRSDVMSGDPFDLERFVAAQDADGVYLRALDELRSGRKETHWIWFVFPQLAGLGRSAMAARFAIRSLAEAQAFVHHETLGPRLIECAGVVAAAGGRTAEEIFEGDAIKVRSSMTLFSPAAPEEAVFRRVLDDYFDGEDDPATLKLV